MNQFSYAELLITVYLCWYASCICHCRLHETRTFQVHSHIKSRMHTSHRGSHAAGIWQEPTNKSLNNQSCTSIQHYVIYCIRTRHSTNKEYRHRALTIIFNAWHSHTDICSNGFLSWMFHCGFCFQINPVLHRMVSWSCATCTYGCMKTQVIHMPIHLSNGQFLNIWVGIIDDMTH